MNSQRKITNVSKAHQKKRNTGLLYEFLILTISSALIEGDKRLSSKALKIIKRHFKPGTQLYREFRLINSLVRTTVTSPGVAASILQEAKMASRSYDLNALDNEKSLLIRSINHSLADENFYDRHVSEYKIYATVQTLINDWRHKDADLGRMASYEDQLTEWLLSEKSKEDDGEMLSESTGTNRLLMKTMMKKMNEKYSSVLSDRQKAILKTYAFSTINESQDQIVNRLSGVKDSLLTSIDEYESVHSDDSFVIEKLNNARKKIIAEDLSDVNDGTIARFMLYVKLDDEMNSIEVDSNE